MGVGSQYLFSLVLLAVVFPSMELAGQTAISGGLTGVIADQSGAVLPSADIELKDSSKGTVRTTKSDQDGVFRFFFSRRPVMS